MLTLRGISRLGELRPFDSRDNSEWLNVKNTFYRPFSGYLGGIHTGGYWVERLAEEWKATFKCNAAVPCNSGTSGLLAACIAAGIVPGDLVYAPVYTMSATASCAMMLGATVEFIDIEKNRFCLNHESLNLRDKFGPVKAIIVTNLFGHPARLHELRQLCDRHKIIMIEDNAQAIGAKEGGKYTGTIGHMGVFSLNVHKHLQVGEGGVVVTNDMNLAAGIRDAVNHGELRKNGKMGLNLRMTEPIAAMACAQLSKLPTIIEGRRSLALEMTDMVKDIPYVEAPKDWEYPVYYKWAAKVWPWKRKRFVKLLNDAGLPMELGYSPLLSDIFKIEGEWPIARQLEDQELINFDICSYDPTARQRRVMRELFKRTGDEA